MSKTLKDLCFLTGVLLPPLALILCFVIKNQEYKHAFKSSIVYGVALWIALAIILSFDMCAPSIVGISDK